MEHLPDRSDYPAASGSGSGGAGTPDDSAGSASPSRRRDGNRRARNQDPAIGAAARQRGDPDDRRRVSLVPNEEATACTMAAMAPMPAGIEAAAAGLTDSEKEAVTRFLAQATEAMRAYARGTDG